MKRRQTDEEFLEFLEETLIPDLRTSGRDMTADDLDRCVRMIRARDDRLARVIQAVTE